MFRVMYIPKDIFSGYNVLELIKRNEWINGKFFSRPIKLYIYFYSRSRCIRLRKEKGKLLIGIQLDYPFPTILLSYIQVHPDGTREEYVYSSTYDISLSSEVFLAVLTELYFSGVRDLPFIDWKRAEPILEEILFKIAELLEDAERCE